MSRRIQGFIIGSSPNQRGEPVWTVRVNDLSSTLVGKKLPIVSVRDNAALARGLNVTFLLGTIDDDKGRPVWRAVDVQLM